MTAGSSRRHHEPVARSLGEATTTSATAGRVADDVPVALRGRRQGWRAPRLWIGIALVAASVVVGGRVLAAADDTVQVWSAAGDLVAGQRVGDDALVAVRVRFADPAALADYYTVDDELPAELAVTRSVGAGELLPRSAVASPTGTGLAELPVAVEPELVPPGIGPGDVVDLYLVARPSAETPAQPGPGPEADSTTGPALAGVSVVEAPDLSSSFGTSGRRQVVLAVPEAEVPAFFALLARYDAPGLAVVRRG